MKKIETLGPPQKIEVTTARGLIVTMDDSWRATSVVVMREGDEGGALALCTETIRDALNAAYELGGPIAAKTALGVAKQLHRRDVRRPAPQELPEG